MKRRVLSGLLSLLLLASHQARAVSKISPEADIPQQPTAPPTLFQKAPPENFRCQRSFAYEGQSYGCDSNIRADGERLRPLLQDTPQAIQSLNIYQQNRRTLQNTAYFGSVGLLILLSALKCGDGNGKNVIILSGAGITAGSFLFGLTSLRANEGNLSEAVRLHNENKPQKPIDLQFSTGISF